MANEILKCNPFRHEYSHLIFDPQRNAREIERAISIQSQQLERWKNVLKRKVFARLEKVCRIKNATAETAEDILRGDQLTRQLKIIKDGFK